MNMPAPVTAPTIAPIRKLSTITTMMITAV